MKKNVKDQVVKALAVGLSAAMMLQPMAAVAEEIDTDAKVCPNKSAGSNEEVAEIESAKAYEAKETLADLKEDTHEFYGSGSNFDVKIPGTDYVIKKADLGDVDDVIRGTDALLASGNDEDIKKAEGELAVNVGNTEAYVKGKEEEIKKELGLLEGLDINYVVTDNLANMAADRGNKDVSDGDAAAEEAMGIADDVSAQMGEYQEKINADMDIIKDAATIAEANAAFEDVSANIAKADVSANAAETAFKTAEDKYNAAKADYDRAKIAYDLAKLDNAATTVALDKTADEISKDAEKIDKTIDVTDDKLFELKTAVEAAQEEFLSSGMGYLLKLEEDAKKGITKISDYATVMDPLFEALVELYYIPEVVGGTFDSATWEVKTLLGEGNYCVVKYKDKDGNDQEIKLNYKLANNNVRGGLVIFEKYEKVTVEGKEISKETLESLKDGETVVEGNGAVVYMKDENGDIYKASGKQKPDVKVTDNDDDEFEITNGATKVEVTETQTTYSIENGQIKETVTGTVTVTTYEENKTDRIKADSEDAAKSAYVTKIEELLEGLADDESIIIGEKELVRGDKVDFEEVKAGFAYDQIKNNLGYTAQVTYYVKYNESVEDIELTKGQRIADKDNSLDNNWRASSEREANAKAQKFSKLLVDEFGYGYVDADGDGRRDEINVSEHELEAVEHRKKNDDLYYTVEGTCNNYGVDVNYIWVNGNQDARKAVGSKGVYLDYIPSWGGYYAVYIPYVTKDLELKENNEAEVQETLKKELSSNANAKIVNTVISEKGEEESYWALNYYLAKKSVSENEVISTSEYAKEEKASVAYTNKNFNEGNILLAEYDYPGYDYINEYWASVALDKDDKAVTKGLRDAIAAAELKAEEYVDLIKKIEKADGDIHAMQADIELLQAQMEAIKKTCSAAKLAKFEADLNAARAVLDAALKERDNLKSQLDAAQQALDDTVRRLTPAPAPVEEEEPAPVQEEVPTPVIAPIVAVIAPTVPAAVAPTPVEEEVEAVVEEVEIAEEEVPQAEAVEEVKEEMVEEPAPVVIEDNDTPLAPIDDAKQMSWWWILVVLVFGTTGAELFRRHQLKKNAAKVEE